MAKARQFERATVMHEGRPLRGFRLACGCGFDFSAHVNSLSRSAGQDAEREAQVITSKFTALGWQVGRRPADDKCPACVQRTVLTNQRHLFIVPTAQESPMQTAAEPPMEMTLQDRQVILRQLVDIFESNGSGYTDDWTDAKVAKALDMPQAWIARLRAENFGPEGSNKEIAAALAHFKEIAGRVPAMNDLLAKLETDFKAMAQRHIAQSAAAEREARDIRERLDTLHAVAKSLNGHLERGDRVMRDIEKKVRS